MRAQRPGWHHLKLQHRYRFNHDKLTVAGIFQRKEGKIILKNMFEYQVNFIKSLLAGTISDQQ